MLVLWTLDSLGMMEMRVHSTIVAVLDEVVVLVSAAYQAKRERKISMLM